MAETYVLLPFLSVLRFRNERKLARRLCSYRLLALKGNVWLETTLDAIPVRLDVLR